MIIYTNKQKKQKTEEMRRKSLETFTEICAPIEDESPNSKRSRVTGLDNMVFLMKKIRN